jgi:hypothetical protein
VGNDFLPTTKDHFIRTCICNHEKQSKLSRNRHSGWQSPMGRTLVAWLSAQQFIAIGLT